jgi:hypothetical protein
MPRHTEAINRDLDEARRAELVAAGRVIARETIAEFAARSLLTGPGVELAASEMSAKRAAYEALAAARIALEAELAATR